MFVYVFSESDRDKLIAEGFPYMKEDPGANAWVFLYDGAMEDALQNMMYVRSQKMCFQESKDENRNGGG